MISRDKLKIRRENLKMGISIKSGPSKTIAAKALTFVTACIVTIQFIAFSQAQASGIQYKMELGSDEVQRVESSEEVLVKQEAELKDLSDQLQFARLRQDVIFGGIAISGSIVIVSLLASIVQNLNISGKIILPYKMNIKQIEERLPRIRITLTSGATTYGILVIGAINSVSIEKLKIAVDQKIIQIRATKRLVSQQQY
jgi:hypothetical protein